MAMAGSPTRGRVSANVAAGRRTGRSHDGHPLGVSRHQLAGDALAVGGADLDAAGTSDHVVAGHDHAVSPLQTTPLPSPRSMR